LFRCTRGGIEEPLSLVTTEVYEDLALAGQLHSLGDDVQVERMCQHDDGGNNGPYFRVSAARGPRRLTRCRLAPPTEVAPAKLRPSASTGRVACLLGTEGKQGTEEPMTNRFGFSWRRLLGITKAKPRVGRVTGIPWARRAPYAKAGRSVLGGVAVTGSSARRTSRNVTERAMSTIVADTRNRCSGRGSLACTLQDPLAGVGRRVAWSLPAHACDVAVCRAPYRAGSILNDDTAPPAAVNAVEREPLDSDGDVEHRVLVEG